MLTFLFRYRFPILFSSLLSILFVGMFVPAIIFDTYVSPVLFVFNIITGLILISYNKQLVKIVIAILVLVCLIYLGEFIVNRKELIVDLVKITCFFIFYLIISVDLIKQVLKARVVGMNEIFGLVSGYISLGLLGVFLCLTVEYIHPNSFSGIDHDLSLSENLIYFSYITLMTIGYGDITPATELARKASILIGLTGQIYIVVITAIIVGKYISHNANK